MIRFKVTSVYNTLERAILDGINYHREITVEWENYSDTFKMIIAETTDDIDKNGVPYTINHVEKTEYFSADATWSLMLENPELYYPAFHALSVAHDGSHMTYMEINKPEILEMN